MKLKIQKIFTKIRNELSNREDELLLEVDNKFEKIFFNQEFLKESQKLPKKVNLFLNKGKTLDKEYDENKLSLLINDCINIEKNVTDINDIKSKIKKSNDSIDVKINFYPLDEEINKFLMDIKKFGEVEKSDSFKSSSIINNLIKEQILINNWIKEKTNKNNFSFELIFKMSEKGTNCRDFHKYCDNKGPTLILVKTNKNKMFGGFTPLNWNNKDGDIYDKSKQTFIFSLNLRKKYDMIDEKRRAICCLSNNGPIFGDSDFNINGNMKKGLTYANSSCNFLKDNNLELTGGKGNDENFETEEIEVYEVKFNDL